MKAGTQLWRWPREGYDVSLDDQEREKLFARFRGYLRFLAEGEVGRKYARRVDASDIVQETLLRAWKDRERFGGGTEEEFAAWLRVLLAHTIANAARDNRRQRRDVNRERDIAVRFENTTRLLGIWLADSGPSPSQKIATMEEIERLADAIQLLPEAQRQAVAFRHLQGLSLKEIAERMRRTEGSVALLIHRGISELRRRLGGTARS